MKPPKKNLKRILMIATGGTIASKRSEDGLKPLITSEELLGYVPDVKEFCEVTAMQVINIDSTNIQPKHWLLISSTIEKYYDQFDGFVVCHGTDTMAYTASALSYLIQNSPKPIVITGAQKPIDLEITDAKTNLSDSFLFASCDKAHGVNIVFDGKVIAGTRGKKERTKSYNAFSSINFPYIATIQDNHIIFYLDDKDRLTEEVTFYHKLDSKVTLLKLIPSMNGGILDYLFKHYDAVIIESFGVGGIHDNAGHQRGKQHVRLRDRQNHQKRVWSPGSLRHDPGSYRHQTHVDSWTDPRSGYGKGNALQHHQPGYSVYNKVESIRTISGSHPRSGFPVLPEAVRGRTAFLILSS